MRSRIHAARKMCAFVVGETPSKMQPDTGVCIRHLPSRACAGKSRATCVERDPANRPQRLRRHEGERGGSARVVLAGSDAVFPRFAAYLINGVFDANVDSSVIPLALT